MAEQKDRFEKGVGSLKGVGEYFVTEQCIDCDLCRQMCPGVFKRAFLGTGSRSVVFQQPGSEHDANLAAAAMEACPVGAIQRGVKVSSMAA
jgi:ferredoxin